MTVFKHRDGSYQPHHFEVNEDSDQIRFWKKWLSKGDVIFEGTYTLNEPVLTLNGTFDQLGPISVRLQRRSDKSRTPR